MKSRRIIGAPVKQDFLQFTAMCIKIEKTNGGGQHMKLLIIRHGDPDYEHDDLTEVGKREENERREK